MLQHDTLHVGSPQARAQQNPEGGFLCPGRMISQLTHNHFSFCVKEIRVLVYSLPKSPGVVIYKMITVVNNTV